MSIKMAPIPRAVFTLVALWMLRLVIAFCIFMIAYLITSRPLHAEDPAVIRRDLKLSQRLQRLVAHQQIDGAEIQAILAQYVELHSCPSRQATLGGAGLLTCLPPPAPPPVAPAKEKAQ